jgi:hypothetical protein
MGRDVVHHTGQCDPLLSLTELAERVGVEVIPTQFPPPTSVVETAIFVRFC